MKLKLLGADFTFPLLQHDQALKLMAMLGSEGVDIGLFESRSHLQPLSKLKNVVRSASKLARKLADRGLKLTDVFLIPGSTFEEMAPNHPNQSVRRAARDQFKRAIDYTVRAGGRHFTALPGVRWKGRKESDSLKQSVDELAWRLEYAGEKRYV